jgi:hypothetical protein
VGNNFSVAAVKVRRRWSDDGLARLGGQLENG